MLQNQHLVVFGSVLPESPRHVGCIDPTCDVESVVYDAFENARFLCDRYYLTSPTMKLEMINAVDKVILCFFHKLFVCLGETNFNSSRTESSISYNV